VKRYVVTLKDEERTQLQGLLACGKASALKQAHARFLLKADAAEGGTAWSHPRIAEAVDVGTATVERVRKRFVEQGLEAAMVRKPQERPCRLKAIDGRAEARLIALACSPPPERRKAWQMKLLADKLVELEVVEAVSDEA
jgi:hypothetical protein